MGTGKRLNLGSSRRRIQDDGHYPDTTEHGNEEQTQVNKEDSDPIFPMSPKYQKLPSNPGSPPRFSATPREKVKKSICMTYYESNNKK